MSSKILFISRAFPPTTGGIENHNYAIAKWLPRHVDTKTLANRFGKIFLPLFLPYATIYALIALTRRDTLLLGDGVLGVVGWVVKLVYRSKRRVVCVVHGLDLTYDMVLYQKLWVSSFIPSCDCLIAVSRQTIKAGVLHGIDETKFVFIPNGVDIESFIPARVPEGEISRILRKDVSNKQILLSCGRLVKRKGFSWFITNIMPCLSDDVIYVICGSGPDKKNIEYAITEQKLAARVLLTGHVSDEDYKLLLNACDIFIQPNIPVQGDMEGFGLVVLEAGSSGVPVVAVDIEGLQDAIQHNINGILVEPDNPSKFCDAILSLLADKKLQIELGNNARKYNADNFQWSSITREYLHICNISPHQSN
jgi:phosphatidylinositol alpha-1,6-mannosyltransferase